MTTPIPAPDLEESIYIDAPADKVWEMVSDVTRMHEWSPQVDSTRLRSGFDTVAVGTQFTNRNSQGDVEWTTHAEVLTFEPPRQIAFKVVENQAIWTYTVTAQERGALLTQRRQAPDGLRPESVAWTEENLGGYQAFGKTMESNVRATLEQIKAAAEA